MEQWLIQLYDRVHQPVSVSSSKRMKAWSACLMLLGVISIVALLISEIMISIDSQPLSTTGADNQILVGLFTLCTGSFLLTMLLDALMETKR